MQSTLIATPDGRMPYFPELDGVRVWCVVLVLFDHLKSNGHGVTWINGHLGVDLFFILSGFLITTLLTREHLFNGRIDFQAFYARRFFRILPAYVAVLVIYAAVLQLPLQSARWVQFKAGLPWFLTLMNEFAREPEHGTVFLHTWSLGVEEKFYLAWPIIFFLLARSMSARVCVVALLFVTVGVAPWLGHGYLARAYFGLLMGCMMGVALSCRFAPRIFAELRRVPAWAALAVFVMGFYVEHRSKNLMVVFSCAAVVYLSFLICHETWLSRMHSARVMVWLGRRSYSMYLVQVLCLNVVEAVMPLDSGLKAGGVLVGAFALTIVVGHVLYRVVEQPAREFGRGYLERHREVAQAV